VPAARVAAALEALDADELSALASTLAPPLSIRVDVKCAREPVYLAFRYRKLGRRTPQSSWVVDGRVKGIGSVEEYVCAAAKAVADCDAVKFAASGREDWDVRMLGNGRPAYAELQNCRKWSSTDVVGDFAREVVKASNGVVEAIQVEIADKARADAVNASAETKVKTYACVVWFGADRSDEDARRVSSAAPLAVQQKTPVRVMHSRSLATREKRVLRLKLELVNPRFGVLELDTSAGMYIKECGYPCAPSHRRASSLCVHAGSSTATSGGRSRASRRWWAATRTSSSSTCSTCTTTSPRLVLVR